MIFAILQIDKHKFQNANHVIHFKNNTSKIFHHNAAYENRFKSDKIFN